VLRIRQAASAAATQPVGGEGSGTVVRMDVQAGGDAEAEWTG
jgi:hypothetical protein